MNDELKGIHKVNYKNLMNFNIISKGIVQLVSLVMEVGGKGLVPLHSWRKIFLKFVFVFGKGACGKNGKQFETKF